MIHVDVRADIRSAQLFLRALDDQKGVARATARALNRTATTVRAESARAIQQERNLLIGTIKQAITITRATTSHLVATITTRGGALSIRHFARLSLTRINGKAVGIRGITSKIRKSGRAVLLQRNGNKAFTTPKIGGGLTVVVRTTKKRLPLKAWSRVPGLPVVFMQDAIVSANKRAIADVFPKRFAEEMNYELNVAKAKAAV